MKILNQNDNIPSRFEMPRQRITVSWLISPIVTVHLVAMAIALEWSQKRVWVRSVINFSIPTIWWNKVKNGPLDPQTICLKWFIFWKN